MAWEDDQKFERDWWGDCTNTFGEETKQITYAHRMGLVNTPHNGHWPVYDMQGKSVVDLGGGPCSMLLKTINLSEGAVVDPCPYPAWVLSRYHEKELRYLAIPAEAFESRVFYDEAWIYNVLQHVIDPAKIIRNALSTADTLRIFEWVDFPPHPGHPHELKADELLGWIESHGVTGRWRTEEMTGENGCHGKAFYGVFS